MIKLLLPRPVHPDFPISSPFGWRTIGKERSLHKGIDFATPVGTPIFAVADGRATRVGWEDSSNHKKGYGKRIMQLFEFGGSKFYCWYGHCSELLIEDGADIKMGQLIAKSGNTGRSTGAHLHFGVRKANTSDFYDVEFYTDGVSFVVCDESAQG